jgi:(2Fe-2S) ferredoxin
MDIVEKIPYKCHVVVCVNERTDERESCAGSNSKEIRSILKESVQSMGWPKKDIRVSQSLCLGMCKYGPVVMIYPQNILFLHVTVDDVPSILEKIKEIMNI